MRLGAAHRGPTRRLLSAPGPQVDLLDARPSGLDEPGLRTWARDVAAESNAAHVSRSYRYPYAIVAGHSGPVGVDIERVQPLAPAFRVSIQTPAERRLAVSGADREGDTWVTSLWSGKEALAKALGDALRYDPRRLESPLAWPEGRCGRWRATSLTGIDGHVGWVCWAVAEGARG